MAHVTANGVRLFYELSGEGHVPIILVHGSWVSHHDWDPLITRLRPTFRVMAYDRRGHSQSERPATPGRIREHVDDLAALIEHLQLAPAWVVGNSSGASIVLRMASERPHLLQGLIAHEPPLFSLLDGDPAAVPMLQEVRAKLMVVGRQIAAGDSAGAAERFVETLALNPGAWARLPAHVRDTMVYNAPTFLDEAGDSEHLVMETDPLQSIALPVLLTLGDESPPQFRPVIEKLAHALMTAEVLTIPAAGHVPHLTHPQAYADAIVNFIRRHQA
jgi:pimeloyl-ACP methyl ester carboxylesterase